jgi:hypothetical protein
VAGKTENATIKPHQLLGQFEDYAELVEKKETEDRTRQAQLDREKREARDLLEMLYRVAGLPMPQRVDNFDAPFRLPSYGYSTPDIGKASVKPLLEGLRKLMADADTARSANLVDG